MSKVSELYTEIEDMLEKGTHPATISAVLDIPVFFVYDVLEVIDNESGSDFDPFNTVNS
jgi:hypothetical protein